MSRMDTRIFELKNANETHDKRIEDNKEKCLNLLNYCDGLKESKVNQ